MNTKLKLIITGTVLACAALAPRAALAGGIDLYEIATPDVGLASAGYAARAQDASTVFKNPAGMSLLQGAQFQGGLQLTYGDVAFSKDVGATSPLLRGDNNGGNAIGALPAGSLFFVQPLSDKFAVGMGALSYFGLAEDFSDGWVGRYYVQKGTLLGMSLLPSASFKATDWLSVGAGLNAMYGYFDSKVAVRVPGSSDGMMQLRDDTWGFGANAGVLVTPREGTRLGVTYLSPVKLDFKDTPSFSGLPRGLSALLDNPAQLNLGMTVPQSVMFSVYQDLNEKWALMANVGWQNWQQFGKVDVAVDSSTGLIANAAPTTIALHYQDTWHGALGAQFKVSEAWRLSAGVAYDSSAVSDANRTLSLPMGQAYRAGLGAEWQVSKAMNLGAAYEFLWAGDMPVTQSSAYRGTVAGAFDNAWFSFFTVNLTYRF
jgi:long-chain fatty acid transport protein